MVRLGQGDRAEMKLDRSFLTAAGYVIAFNVRVSYTVETDSAGYSASACSKLAGGYVRIGDKNEAAGAAAAAAWAVE